MLVCICVLNIMLCSPTTQTINNGSVQMFDKQVMRKFVFGVLAIGCFKYYWANLFLVVLMFWNPFLGALV